MWRAQRDLYVSTIRSEEDAKIRRYSWRVGWFANLTSGLPGNHPLVWGQGFNGTIVQAGIEEDTKNALAAGYNVKGTVTMRFPEPIAMC
jgi:hypothetical protein